MYTKQSIDRVREADIVTVVGSFCSDLKKQGANYFCKSPFKDEKTASLSVSPSKEIFKDFGSGISGDGITFVMEHEKCDFIEAVKIIAGICNILLDEEVQSPEVIRAKKETLSLTTLTTNIAKKYHQNFRELPETHWAKKHIANLGYNDGTILEFNIGFAHKNNEVTKALIDNAKLAEGIKIGVSKADNNKSYDFYRERIMFPITNKNGETISFGGRRQNGEAFEKYAKYLNGPETEIYNKSEELYGFRLAKRSIAKSGFAIISEGYTDVITMHQKGCSQTVATCGTALTEIQAKKLKRLCEHIILFRDGDKAGVKASERDLEILLKHGFRVSIVPLPNGTDPDDCARGQIDMPTFIKDNRVDAFEWRVKNLDLLSEEYILLKTDLDLGLKTAVLGLSKEKVSMEKLKTLKDKELKDAIKKNANVKKEIIRLQKEVAVELNKYDKEDPYKKEHAIKKIAELLFKITSEVVQESYLKHAAKLLNQKQQVFKSLLSELRIEKQNKIEKASGGKGISKDTLGLPEGADQAQFLQDRFCVIGNTYHFTKGDGFFQGTQFKLTPLFHIKGRKENKRLCEVINIYNKKELVDFESDSFINFTDFKKRLVNLGYYIFINGSTVAQFELLAQKVLREFNTALELQNMGWNSKGFFAFANGVYWQDKFQEVNKYGIIHLEGVDTSDEDEEFNEKVDYYYSPAYSAMHVKNQDGDDPYENDRKFIYRKATITLQEWMQQFLTVFEEKGRVGILFNFAVLFRDLFLTNYDFFPLLGGFGEKGSGKSAFGKMLQNFFFYKEDPLELNTSTLVGFSRRLSRTKNATVFLDEYNDNAIDEKMFQGLKGAHQGMGREKGMATSDNRTKTDKINCGIYLAGQYLPTRDDNSLQSRLISLQFPLGNKTSVQRENFTKLMNASTQGLSSLILEVVQHRQLFEDAIGKTYNEVIRELKAVMDAPGKEQEYEERILGNYAVLLITYKILESRITFPFNYQSIFKQCVAGIIENSESIQDSNGLSEFWSIIQWMHEHKHIAEGYQFAIDTKESVKLIGKQKKTVVHENKEGRKILYLRLNSVHQDYTKECTKREGVQAIGEVTLRNYFKSRSYFIGLVKARRFKTGGSSCYAFDYEAMKRNNIVCLDKIKEDEDDEEDESNNSSILEEAGIY
ncbi:DNA primase [Tenacibaculum finnmarkense genomovar ulcerans]|uniref:DNA primase n=1 Tax=Tenacibaculum finnmarkense TaxID=2781243 RepID=UPI001E496F63|nr:DNA primase [Tenacibaculum finnmarkense]MCD8431015.1 DNA primase [Tenacibaculum finnmarkense genomovar ulcerans]